MWSSCRALRSKVVCIVFRGNRWRLVKLWRISHWFIRSWRWWRRDMEILVSSSSILQMRMQVLRSIRILWLIAVSPIVPRWCWEAWMLEEFWHRHVCCGFREVRHICSTAGSSRSIRVVLRQLGQRDRHLGINARSRFLSSLRLILHGRVAFESSEIPSRLAK